MARPFELEIARDRDDLAPAFRAFATAFAENRPLRIRGEGESVAVVVPERVDLELEVEREGDATELELDLEWADPAGSSVLPGDDAPDDAVDVLLAAAPDDRTSRFEVYEDRDGEWRWRLVHWNGNVVADGGEGYASRSNAERAVRGVRRIAPAARLDRLDD